LVEGIRDSKSRGISILSSSSKGSSNSKLSLNFLPVLFKGKSTLGTNSTLRDWGGRKGVGDLGGGVAGFVVAGNFAVIQTDYSKASRSKFFKGPNGDIQVVHITTAPSFVGVFVGSIDTRTGIGNGDHSGCRRVVAHVRSI